MSFQSSAFQPNAFQESVGLNPPGAIKLLDNCIFTPTLGGLTDFRVAAAVTGSRTLVQAGAAVGDRYYYVARSADQTQWEAGLGTCLGDYISRDSPIWSSNSNNFVNFSVVPTVSIDALTDNFRWRRQQRSVTTTPIVILSTDQIINCNIPSPATCTLPSSASRNGIPLTFKDVGGQFAANNLTITPIDPVDGVLTSIVLSNNRAAITLVPFADGANVGWVIE